MCEYCDPHGIDDAKHAIVLESLQSISRNSCCESCQEAAAIAKKALRDISSVPSQRREGHSALRFKKGELETFDPNPRIGGEMLISITQNGYICAYGKESRTASSWQDLTAWLKHHGEAAINQRENSNG